MIGGLDHYKQPFQSIQYLQFKVDFLETKVCKVCRQAYGIKQVSLGSHNLTVRYESEAIPRRFMTSEIVGRISNYIGYPFSAMSLLIDNSLNLSGTNIDIKFGIVEGEIIRLRNERVAHQYSYISINDDSFGFSQHEILESLSSFSIKSQKITSDTRFEEEMEIRKEYGINVKLGCLRLGKSCLYITKLDDHSRFFAYFSTNKQFASSPFNIYSYILNEDGNSSSEVSRHLIRQEVEGKIPPGFETETVETLVYIFDLPRKEF